MNPIETITAAREWLTQLRAEATEGPWEREEMPETRENRIVRNFEFFGEQMEQVAPGGVRREDAALIVALCHPDVLDAIDKLLTDELAESGVCYCGDDMKNHSLEHNFVDMGYPPNEATHVLATALLATKGAAS